MTPLDAIALAGDTIVVTHVCRSDSIAPNVADTRGDEVRIRFWGIDAPEKAQPHGVESTERLGLRIPVGTTVVINKVTEDKYGRWVAMVGHSPTAAATNFEVVEFGDAFHWAVFDAADNDCLASAEVTAVAGSWGVWATPEPQRPWDFRRAN